MTIFIRADASVSIGSGHVMRTLELARRMDEKGCRIIYLCKPVKGNLIGYIRQKGFEVRELPSGAGEYEAVGHAIEAMDPDLLIIDHYGIGAEVEKQLKERYGIVIVALDDTFEKHYCDMVLNQNIYASEERYGGLVPLGTKLLTGLGYALVRDEFSKALSLPVKAHMQTRLLVTLGGSDPHNVLFRILMAMSALRQSVSATLICGPSNPRCQELKERFRHLKKVKILQKTDNMAGLMRTHDMAVTAAGASTIESLIMKLPALIIATADNQKELATTLGGRELAEYAGWHEELDAERLREVLEVFMAGGYKKIKKNLEALKLNVNGADVVADEILQLKSEHAG